MNLPVRRSSVRRSGFERALGPAALLALVGAFATLALPSVSESSPTAGTAGVVTVKIFMAQGNMGNRCDRVVAVKRSVQKPGLLAGAMRALLAGPTVAEKNAGYHSWFSVKTKGMLRSVRVARGIAYVDFQNFSHVIPNASTSCGSGLLLAQLNRTARQFVTVKQAIFSFDGSRDAFYNWLQMDAP
jgi:spore germination protein GerM